MNLLLFPLLIVALSGITSTTASAVNADVVFVLDISQSVSAQQFADTKEFIINALKDYEVGFKKDVQVGIMSIYGDYEGFAMVDSYFDGIQDNKQLETALDNSYPDDAQKSGEGNIALIQALKIAAAPEFKALGYRNDTENHLIVYVTTNSIPNYPAIAQAQLIMGKNLYKILAISYQNDGSNYSALTKLVGGNPGCVLTPSNKREYLADAQKLADRISQAQMNGGNYC